MCLEPPAVVPAQPRLLWHAVLRLHRCSFSRQSAGSHFQRQRDNLQKGGGDLEEMAQDNTLLLNISKTKAMVASDYAPTLLSAPVDKVDDIRYLRVSL